MAGCSTIGAQHAARAAPGLKSRRGPASGKRGKNIAFILGNVAGGLLAGMVADAMGCRIAIATVALLTAVSGAVAMAYLSDPPNSDPDEPTKADLSRDAAGALVAAGSR